MSKKLSSTIEKVIAIGDIHGCASMLDRLLRKIPLKKGDTIVFLGDYIDRGNQSKEVVDIILNLKKDYNIVALMGNHEAMLLSFLKDPAAPFAGAFIYNGGMNTLASYGDNFGNFEIPPEHIEFFKSLDIYCEWREYFFVHAACPNIPINDINLDEHTNFMLWARDDFYRNGYHHNRTIIHGHTPVPEPEVDNNRINIDTGCVYNNMLTALFLPEEKFYSLENTRAMEPIILKDDNSKRRSVRFQGEISGTLMKDDELIYFETINYSPFGMLIKTDYAAFELMQDDHIDGVLKFSRREKVRFEGKILRRLNLDLEIRYALKITTIF